MADDKCSGHMMGVEMDGTRKFLELPLYINLYTSLTNHNLYMHACHQRNFTPFTFLILFYIFNTVHTCLLKFILLHLNFNKYSTSMETCPMEPCCIRGNYKKGILTLFNLFNTVKTYLLKFTSLKY